MNLIFMRNLKLILTIIVFFCAAVGASAQDKATYEKRKAKLEREIAIIDKQLAENSSKSSSLLSDLTLLRKKVANRKALVEESDRQIKSLNNQIYQTQKEGDQIRNATSTVAGWGGFSCIVKPRAMSVRCLKFNIFCH